MIMTRLCVLRTQNIHCQTYNKFTPRYIRIYIIHPHRDIHFSWSSLHFSLYHICLFFGFYQNDRRGSEIFFSSSSSYFVIRGLVRYLHNDEYLTENSSTTFWCWYATTKYTRNDLVFSLKFLFHETGWKAIEKLVLVVFSHLSRMCCSPPQFPFFLLHHPIILMRAKVPFFLVATLHLHKISKVSFERLSVHKLLAL